MVMHIVYEYTTHSAGPEEGSKLRRRLARGAEQASKLRPEVAWLTSVWLVRYIVTNI